jgi:hypothetical protein
MPTGLALFDSASLLKQQAMIIVGVPMLYLKLFVGVTMSYLLLQIPDSDYTFAILKLFVPTHGYFEYFIHINPSPFHFHWCTLN